MPDLSEGSPVPMGYHPVFLVIRTGDEKTVARFDERELADDHVEIITSQAESLGIDVEFRVEADACVS